MVAHYTFDNAADLGNDDSGGWHDWMVNWTAFGWSWKIGWSVDFNYPTGWNLTMPASSFQPWTESFSIWWWVNNNSLWTPISSFLVTKSTACFANGSQYIGFDIWHGNISNGIAICLRDDQNNTIWNTVLNFDDGYRPGQLVWSRVHQMYVFDRINGKVKAYINGVEQTNTIDISHIVWSLNSNQALRVWQAYWWSVDGKIDDLRIYNRALSASEIERMYKGANGGLVGYYPFDDGTADDQQWRREWWDVCKWCEYTGWTYRSDGKFWWCEWLC